MHSASIGTVHYDKLACPLVSVLTTEAGEADHLSQSCNNLSCDTRVDGVYRLKPSFSKWIQHTNKQKGEVYRHLPTPSLAWRFS